MEKALRQGDTLLFPAPPVIAAHAAVGGKKESESPLASAFDELSGDNLFGQKNWEAAERALQLRAARLCLRKGGAAEDTVSLALAGDLQAQCTASSYAMRELGVPYAGLFGACSTMAEALGLGAALCAGGMAEGVLAMASGHFCAAERQFRTPLCYGAVRTPTAQWTATAAGCCLLRPAGPDSAGVPVRGVTFGRVQDYQVRDITNMGAAMAPAAAATLLRYLRDTGTPDCIYTGDLGRVGSALLAELLEAEGIGPLHHEDCGCLLYGRDPKVHSGASGPGCCASVLCGHILPQLEQGKLGRVLFIATGALMSQTTFLQKESIPAVAHLVELGGAICAAGQLLVDLTSLTPARILTGYVVAGVALSALGLYGPLADFAGAGASVPLLGFGHLLAQGVRQAVAEQGLLGCLTGGLRAGAAGITASLLCGVIAALLGKSRDQN